jgi:hypothetical protein
VAILFHERQGPDRAPFYAIHHLAEIWRSDGLDVVYLFGAGEFVAADVAIVQVDLSVVPEEYLELARRYPVAWNAELKDIRKSTLSTLRVTRESDHTGPVIAKSNLNYAGVPERVLDGAVDDGPFRASTEYRVYESISEVPDELLDSPDVIVEKFLPEVEHGRFHVRTLEFVGDRHTSLRATADHHVVSDATQLEVEPIEAPPELFELRRRPKLDYGKFDYVVHGSMVSVLDVNKTVGASVSVPSGELAALRRDRADGIYRHLR